MYLETVASHLERRVLYPRFRLYGWTPALILLEDTLTWRTVSFWIGMFEVVGQGRKEDTGGPEINGYSRDYVLVTN